MIFMQPFTNSVNQCLSYVKNLPPGGAQWSAINDPRSGCGEMVRRTSNVAFALFCGGVAVGPLANAFNPHSSLPGRALNLFCGSVCLSVSLLYLTIGLAGIDTLKHA